MNIISTALYMYITVGQPSFKSSQRQEKVARQNGNRDINLNLNTDITKLDQGKLALSSLPCFYVCC